MKPIALTPFIIGAFLLSAQAQFSINWYKVAGGGGASASGLYSLSGTIGQPDAGAAMAGGNYSVTGGFWALVAVPTPGAPSLTIHITPINTVLISWPSPSTGFILQQNSDLSGSAWTTASQIPLDDGTTNNVIVNPLAGHVFYRLKY